MRSGSARTFCSSTLCFVPLTEDKRLSAKEIVGNKKKLTWWQDEFWKHMVKKYPDLERGESASETGRTHIPPRLFKEAVHLNRIKEQVMAILNDSNPFNKKAKAEELEALLDKYKMRSGKRSFLPHPRRVCVKGLKSARSSTSWTSFAARWKCCRRRFCRQPKM